MPRSLQGLRGVPAVMRCVIGERFVYRTTVPNNAFVRALSSNKASVLSFKNIWRTDPMLHSKYSSRSAAETGYIFLHCPGDVSVAI